jgi:hypothetical protein
MQPLSDSPRRSKIEDVNSRRELTELETVVFLIAWFVDLKNIPKFLTIYLSPSNLLLEKHRRGEARREVAFALWKT